MKLRPLVAVAVLAVVPLVGAVGPDITPGAASTEEKSVPVSASGSEARRTVLVYGDSLMWEAQELVRSFVGERADVEIDSFGGTALCDYSAIAVERAVATDADLVVFEFSGNALTPCMRGARGGAVADRYRADADRVAAQLVERGVDVAFVTPPPALDCAPGAGKELEQRSVGELPTGCDVTTHPLDQVYRDVADDAQGDGADVVAVDGTRGLTSPSGGWTKVLPCAPGEGAAQGCEDGLVDVRAADLGHFCPEVATSVDGVVARCPVYSPGAFRFASTIADAIVELERS